MIMENQNEIFDVNYVAEVELIYKNQVKPALRPMVTNASSTYQMFLNSWDLGKIELQEHFKVMLLNQGNKVLGIFSMSAGGVSATVVDRKLIFATALKANASKIILAHNHPSGSLRPSTSDIDLTKMIVTAGKILEITVLDHLIITREGYYSFADEGLI
ncbi:hypothetical protein D3C87_130200 [compost metagenome]